MIRVFATWLAWISDFQNVCTTVSAAGCSRRLAGSMTAILWYWWLALQGSNFVYFVCHLSELRCDFSLILCSAHLGYWRDLYPLLPTASKKHIFETGKTTSVVEPSVLQRSVSRQSTVCSLEINVRCPDYLTLSVVRSCGARFGMHICNSAAARHTPSSSACRICVAPCL